MAVLVFVFLEEWQTNRKITTHLANDKSYENLSQAPWATLLPSVGIQTLVPSLNPVLAFSDTGLP